MDCTDNPKHTLDQIKKLAHDILDERRTKGILRKAVQARAENDLILSSNDYFGLSRDQRVCEAAAAATFSFGTSSGGSRLLHVRHAIHQEIESTLTSHLPAGWRPIFINSGTAANVVFFDVLSKVLPQAEVYLDHLSHASLIFAAKSSGLNIRYFRHNDWTGLSKKIQLSSHPKKLIVLEGLHSMEGDFINWKAISEVCESNPGCLLFIDEAHSAGLLGLTGGSFQRSIFSMIENSLVGTMLGCGKAFGTCGGLLVLPHQIADLCYQFGRQLIYTTDAPPATLAALSRSLNILAHEGGAYITNLSNLVIEICTALQSQIDACNAPVDLKIVEQQFGKRSPISSHSIAERPEYFQIVFHKDVFTGILSPIVTIFHRDQAKLRCVQEMLSQQGIDLAFIRSPTVQQGRERLRLSICLQVNNDQVGQKVTPWYQHLAETLIAAMRIE